MYTTGSVGRGQSTHTSGMYTNAATIGTLINPVKQLIHIQFHTHIHRTIHREQSNEALVVLYMKYIYSHGVMMRGRGY